MRMLSLIICFLLFACDNDSKTDHSSSNQKSNYNLYVSDAGNFSTGFKILKYDEFGKNPKVFTSSNLSWPQDILFVDNQNLVLISNLNSGNITKYNASTGAYLGNFATGLAGPTRMKIGPDGKLYVLQWNATTNKIKRYDLNGTILGDFTSVGVASAIGIDWDSQGNLYVSSYYDDLVRKFDSNGNDLGLFISENLVGPTNIWFDDSGDLLVSDYDGGSIKRFSSTGTYKGVFISGLGKSEGILTLPNGDILIGNGQTSSVKKYTSSGQFIKDVISAGSGGLITPNAIAVNPVPTN